MEEKELLDILHPHQLYIINEIKERIKIQDFSGLCMSLPMGYGKTIISVVLGLLLYKRFLIICSKTLISSWISEINKFFGDKLNYEILHKDYLKNKMDTWKPLKETRVIITTPEVVSMSCVPHILEQFVYLQPNVFQPEKIYAYPTNPFNTKKKGYKYLHCKKWEGIFIDECQNYLNIGSKRTLSIGSLCCNHRWLLSGTVFQEIDLKRILGFFILLNLKVPRSISVCKEMVFSYRFKGINQYCIERKVNPNFKDIKLDSQIISFKLNEKESICYALLKQMVSDIFKEYKRELNKVIIERDKEKVKQLSGCLLAMITYLRQSLIIPQIAISRSLIRMINSTDNLQIICKSLQSQLTKYGLNDWINSSESEISTRIQNCIDILLNHKNDVVVIFGSYVNCMELVKKKYEEVSDTPTLLLESSMKIDKRAETFNEFQNSKKCVLFLTYMLGAEGLNLQHANIVVHLDLYWNKGKENQALARVFRSGQIHPVVTQYILISNTGIEKAMLEKQRDKLVILSKLKTGNIANVTITGIKMQEVVQILERDRLHDLANVVNTIN